MRRTRTRALAGGCVLLLAVGCAHSERTGKPDVKDATAPEQRTESQVRAKKVTPKTPPGHPPLAASPAELMEPGAQRKISQALKSKGVVQQDALKGEQLTEALRKFQQSQGLAATGFPDHETLLRLGIDPKEVDTTLENFSGSRPGEAQADVQKGSSHSGKGGSGDEGSSTGANQPGTHGAPPQDASGKGRSESANGGG